MCRTWVIVNSKQEIWAHLKSNIIATCKKDETFAQDMKMKTESLSISIQTKVSQYPDEEKRAVNMLASAKDPIANWNEVAW